MKIQIPSEWTDLDRVTHKVWANRETKRPEYIQYSLSIILPIVNKQVYVCNRLSPIEVQPGLWDRLAKDGKAKIARMARLEYYRFYKSQIKKK
jgi:hypothetical protein